MAQQNPAQRTGFLSLPAELQVQIFTPLVQEEYPIWISTCKINQQLRPRRWPRGTTDYTENYYKGEDCDLEPALATLCRAVRMNCLEAFYKNNKFYVKSSFAKAAAFLRMLGPTKVKWLKEFEVEDIYNLRPMARTRFVRHVYDCIDEDSEIFGTMRTDALTVMMKGDWDYSTVYRKLHEIDRFKVIGKHGDWVIAWKKKGETEKKTQVLTESEDCENGSRRVTRSSSARMKG